MKLPQVRLTTGRDVRMAIGMLMLMSGCAHPPGHTIAATQPVMEKNIEKSRGPYWYARPDVASVECGNFEALWNAAVNVARDSHFTIDRTDYREGFLTTTPLVSKQPFEIWRSDVIDGHSMAQSALGTVRRTIQFHFKADSAGGYRCVPKVLVERESYAERRITSVNEYKDVFSYTRALSERGTDEDQPIQIDYWYALGRDSVLEKHLASEVRERLRSRQCN